MDEAARRRFPQALEAERALLGGLMLDPARTASVSELVKAEDFYRQGHARLFALLLERVDAGLPIDLVSLTELLVSSGSAEELGGLGYLSGLQDAVPSTENLDHYARLVRDMAIRRRLIQAAREIADSSYEGQQDLATLLDGAERAVFEVTQDRVLRDWRRLSLVIDEEWKRLESLSERPSEVTGVPTGYVDLDRQLAGLQPSDLVILAARPGMGKTALALNIAQNASVGRGIGVGVLSLEMSRGQLGGRLLSAEARVDASKLRTGRLSRDVDWPALSEAAERLYQAPLWIDDTPGLTVTQVRSKARRLKAEHAELGLLVVDYLQLMQGTGGPRESREQVISSISRGLKGLAKELDIPVLALSQLNRGVESRPKKRPLISDLRESGAIEQDADVVLFIYRDDYYHPDSPDQGTAELIVAKHRHGPTGTVRLAFRKELTRFENLARDGDIPGGYA